jgi:hypothetical protein
VLAMFRERLEGTCVPAGPNVPRLRKSEDLEHSYRHREQSFRSHVCLKFTAARLVPVAN